MSSRWWSRPVAALGSIGLVGALLLAGAVPLADASSSTKTYTLTVSAGSTAGTFSATFTDTTPNASINSLTLTLPAGYAFSIPTGTPCSTIVSASSGIGNCSVSSSTTSTGRSMITVTNLNPAGYQQTVTLTFSPTISSQSCDNIWNSTAFTGSSLSGTAFNPVSYTTGIAYTLAGGQTSTVSSTTVAGVTVTNNSSTTASFGVGCSANNQVSVTKPAGSTATLNLTVDILWDPERAVTPLPPTQVDTPSPTHDIQWCNGRASYDSAGNLITSGLSMPGSEVACLVKETSQIVGPDSSGNQQAQVHDLLFLKGDPTILR